MEKIYLIFSMIPDWREFPSSSIIGIKKLKEKRCYHCHVAFSDGFIIDYRKEGLILGPQRYPGKYPYYFPVVECDDDLEYHIIKHTGNRDQMLSIAHNYIGAIGEDERDLLAILNNEEVRSLKDRTRITSDTLIALMLGEDDFWTYDTDKLYKEFGEKGIPGKITDFELE